MEMRRLNFNLKWNETEQALAKRLAVMRGVSIADLLRMLIKEEGGRVLRDEN